MILMITKTLVTGWVVVGETVRRKGRFEEKDKGVHFGHDELRSLRHI